DVRRAAALVAHARLSPARERDALGCRSRDQTRLRGRQPSTQTFEQLARARGLAKLGETPAPLAHLFERRTHFRVAERGERLFRERARRELHAREETLQRLPLDEGPRARVERGRGERASDLLSFRLIGAPLVNNQLV